MAIKKGFGFYYIDSLHRKKNDVFSFAKPLEVPEFFTENISMKNEFLPG